MSNTPQNTYIIEYYQVGNSVKVSAIDPVTLTEACIVGDPKVSKKELSDLAVRKLEYVMKKKPSTTS